MTGIFTFFTEKNLAGLFLVATLLFLFSCGNKNDKNTGTQKPVVTVKVEEATVGDIADSVEIFGEVKLRNETFVGSQFDGRLTGFSLIEGDEIEKGEKLGIIVPPMREALMQSAGNLTPSQKKLIADEVKEIPFYSPINGVVVNVMHHNGDVLKKGDPVVHIADLSHLDIYGNLPVKYLAEIKKQDLLSVKFIDFPQKNIRLHVSAIGGKADTKAQTVKIRLSLDNRTGIYKPGMRVILSFAGKIHKNSTLIPKPALLEEEGICSVFTVENSRAVKKVIKTGIRYNDKVEVLSGIEPGEKVVVDKAYSLTDGMEVSER